AVAGQAQDRLAPGGVASAMKPHQDVVQDAELLEQADVLEGAGHPQIGDPMGRQPGDLGPIQGDAAAAGLQKAADQVEDRGLTGAVGADKTIERTFRNLQTKILQGQQTTESHAQVLDIQELHGLSSHFRRPSRRSQENSRRPNRPRRKKRITSSRARESSTRRSPGMPGKSRPQSRVGSSTTRSHSPARVKKTAATTAPVVEPRPPTTMMMIRWARRPPPAPRKKALKTKASIRWRKESTPVARAAISSSRTACMAR